MSDMIKEVIVTMLMTLAVSGMGVCLGYLARFVNASIESLSRNEKLVNSQFSVRTLEFFKGFLNDIIVASVAAMEQTTAKDLREKVKAGISSRDELVALSVQVKENIKAQLEPSMVKNLSFYISDLDKYIENKIEEVVLELKNSSVAILLGEAIEPAKDTQRTED